MKFLNCLFHTCKYIKHKKLKVLGYHKVESEYGKFYFVTTKTESLNLSDEPTTNYILQVSCTCGNKYYTNPI